MYQSILKWGEGRHRRNTPCSLCGYSLFGPSRYENDGTGVFTLSNIFYLREQPIAQPSKLLKNWKFWVDL